MFLIKFFYFLKGYVIIEAYEKSVLNLISECALQGIRIYNVVCGNKIMFSVLRSDVTKVSKLSEKFGTELKTVKECGLLYTISRYKKRVFFPIGALVFVLFFALSSRFLWDIRIEGTEKLSKERVLEVLDEIGVRPGVRLSKLPDGAEMKNHLTSKLENVPWAWVYIDGVRARVSIHEGTVQPMLTDDSLPCDIIASRDGFVTEMSVKKGMKSCLPGNAVNAGEVLISGFVQTSDDKEGFEVHADGEVLALTHRELTKTYSLFENRPVFSGAKKSIFEITLFSKSFELFKKPDYSYSISKESRFGLPFIGFSAVKRTYYEAEKNSVQLPTEWVTEFAKRDLTAIVSSELQSFSRLITEDFTTVENGDSLTVTVKMDFLESIGVCVPR